LQGIGKARLTEDYSAALLQKTLIEGYADSTAM